MKQILIEKNIKPTDDDLQLINTYTRTTVDENDVYLFSIVLCDNDVDRDGERFTTESLYELAELFVGKTEEMDYKRHRNERARIISCEVERSNNRKTALGDNYAKLIARAYIPIYRINNDIISAIDNGTITKVDIHCAVGAQECSVCGEDYSECSHKKGEVYDSKLCCCELSEPYYAYGWSFVASKADKNEIGIIWDYI